MPEYKLAKQLLEKSGWSPEYRIDIEKAYPELFREIFRIKRNRTLVKGFKNIKPELEKYCGLEIDINADYGDLCFSLGFPQSFYKKQSNYLALRDFLQEDIIQIGLCIEHPIFMNMQGTIYQVLNHKPDLYVMENILQTIECNYYRTVDECPTIDINRLMVSLGIPILIF